MAIRSWLIAVLVLQVLIVALSVGTTVLLLRQSADDAQLARNLLPTADRRSGDIFASLADLQEQVGDLETRVVGHPNNHYMPAASLTELQDDLASLQSMVDRICSGTAGCR